ncbi:MAG: BON domain-containing protein [Acidobacteria bacterium]|nr:BON domain-containing protein [Acidobacteriota bacterium]
MRRATFLTLMASLLVAPALLPAQDRTTEQIRKEIAKQSDYGVFDNIVFKYTSGTATLMGEASRPQLKKQAEKTVSRIEGVQKVDNEIEVLPNSNVDDGIRTMAYIKIYGNPNLSRYNPNRGTPLFASLTRMTFGLTQDPPAGQHPIHIVVKNSEITLEGVVDTEGDKVQAGMEANSVNGALKVTNNLRVGGGNS